MKFRKDFKFVDEATAPTTSNAFWNNGTDVMTLQIDGTFTNASVTVEGQTNLNGDYYSLCTINLATLTTNPAPITQKGQYALDISGLKNIRVVVNSVSGGNITVYALCSEMAGV